MSEGLIRRWTPSNLVSFGKEPNRKSCMGLRKSWISITWTSGKWSLYLKTKGVLGGLGIINTKLTNVFWLNGYEKSCMGLRKCGIKS